MIIINIIILLIYAGAAIFAIYYLPILAKDFKRVRDQNDKIIQTLDEIAKLLKEKNNNKAFFKALFIC
ncbi:hypothetical protein KDJ21_017520 [Metabacillus litoralis]|uniref:hypothetical protein n=1 Tax=Metabacillus litoralis TaxID=152268 RepID=UPI001E5C253C|nr:hypothetical protein [Metabacillus litoralis]UHA58623.1 hypothetical protein KDJ21_017520 [Metabacillus litoralis]